MRFLFFLVCVLFLFSDCSGDKKRGHKARLEAEATRTKEPASMADKYARIDKACNRLEVMVDTVSTDNTLEVSRMRKEIATLRVEAKDIASDYEASKLSGDVEKELVETGVNYLFISNLSSRIERINDGFRAKFGN